MARAERRGDTADRVRADTGNTRHRQETGHSTQVTADRRSPNSKCEEGSETHSSGHETHTSPADPADPTAAAHAGSSECGNTPAGAGDSSGGQRLGSPPMRG